MSKKIIALVSNNMATDQRLIKVGSSLQKRGFDFTLIGTNHRGSPSLTHIPFSTRRVSIIFSGGFLFYSELQLRLFWALLTLPKKGTVILANDLDTLLPAYIISKLYQLPLVFDSHEIFSELPSLAEKSIQKKVWKFLERWLVPKVDQMYTVSKSYANFFKNNYGVEAAVVSNFPMLYNNHIIKNSLEINLKTDKDYKVLIYQGAINYSRGIDKMILAMNYLENTMLWIVGDGPFKTKFENLVNEQQLNHKVKFLGQLKPHALKSLTPKANLGLSLEEDHGLSYRYALPNKIFDYIHAGIPVLGSSDLPEVQNIIEKYQIGDVIENHEPEHIADKLKEMLGKSKAHYTVGLEKARIAFQWENHEEILCWVFETANSHR